MVVVKRKSNYEKWWGGNTNALRVVPRPELIAGRGRLGGIDDDLVEVAILGGGAGRREASGGEPKEPH
jgi:hypothetical protein